MPSNFLKLIRMTIFLLFFPPIQQTWAETPIQIEKFLNHFNKSENLKKLLPQNGAIAITHHNKVIYKNLFGYKKNKLGKITSDTLFPLASSSKPISAALIAYLVKQNKLSLDESLHSVITGIDSRVQLKHILSHSSGYDDKIGNKSIESGKNRNVLIHLYDQSPPTSPPGTTYSYSNVLFSLLEDLISSKTQSTYEKSLAEFLGAIGIQGEAICRIENEDRVAFPHQPVQKRLKSIRLPKLYSESVCSAGGLYLSLDQMVQFTNVMLGHMPQILNKNDLDLLFQPQVEVTDIFKKWMMKWPYPVPELKSYYALGWRTLERNRQTKNRLIFHSGHLNGVSTFIGLVPEKDLGIVILSNQDFIFTEPLGMDFWKYAEL